VWTLTREAGAVAISSITMRDRAGERTEDAKNLRRFSGLEE
jgi:hypothetical protein